MIYTNIYICKTQGVCYIKSTISVKCYKVYEQTYYIGRKWVTTETKVRAWHSRLMSMCFLPGV